jgi:hypothetical protein
MAIEKAIFTASGYDRATEIATWLQANATEYFDTIELQENGYEVKCNIDGVTVLDIQVAHSNTSAACSVTLINGTSQTASTSNIIGAYKTSNGVCLYMEGATYNSSTDPSTGEVYYQYSGGRDIFICKSDKGNTSFAFNIYSSYSGGGNLGTVDAKADSRFSKWLNNTDTSYECVGKRPLTVLSPLPLGNGGTVAEGVYFTPFSQYKGINNPIILSADGKDYVYDGAFALEE